MAFLVDDLVETAEGDLQFRQRDALLCGASLGANPTQTDDCRVKNRSRDCVLDAEASN